MALSSRCLDRVAYLPVWNPVSITLSRAKTLAASSPSMLSWDSALLEFSLPLITAPMMYTIHVSCPSSTTSWLASLPACRLLQSVNPLTSGSARLHRYFDRSSY